MSELYTAKQIAGRVGCTLKTVSVRLKKVDYTLVKGDGPRSVRGYKLAGLPADWQATVAKERVVNDSESNSGVKAKLSNLSACNDDCLAVATARAWVVRAADAYCVSKGYKVRKGSVSCKKSDLEFLQFLKAGCIEGGLDRIAILSRCPSWSTLNRWRKKLNDGGVASLSDQYVAPNRGATVLTKEQQDKLIALMTDKPLATIKNLHRGLQAAMGTMDAPDERVIARFVDRWKRENAELWTACVDPSGWKNKHMAALGSASDGIERLYQLLEGDSSPSDIMLQVDGKLKRFALIALIDIYSRQAQLVVSPTSTGEAIVTAIRRWITEKGVPEALRIDNGKDWISKRVEAVLCDLQIDTTLCGKFKSEEKGTVERFFKTFSHGAIELNPHFIGHNVSDRQKIEAQKTFAQRIMKTGGPPVEIAATPEEFQEFCDKWVEYVYGHDYHRGLKCKPIEKVRSWKHPVRRITDQRLLDNLLLPAVHRGGTRVIGKKGVQVDAGKYQPYYVAEDFAEHMGKSVYVFIDPLDMGRIVCYLPTEDGGREYLCEAFNLEMSGVNRAEFAAKVKKAQARHVKEQKRELNRKVKEAAIEEVQGEYIRLREAEARNGVVEMPKRVEELVTPAIEEARKVGAQQSVTEEVKPVRKKSKVHLLVDESQYYENLRRGLEESPRDLTASEKKALREFYRTLKGKAALRLHGNLLEKYGGQKKIVNI